MKRLAYASLALALGAAASQAAPLTNGPLESRFAGAELRMTLHGSEHQYENHLWRFRADGTVYGDMNYYFVTARAGNFIVERRDIGRWRLASDDRICVTWNEFFFTQGNETCFRVDTQHGAWVRLTTDRGQTWNGTLHPWHRGE